MGVTDIFTPDARAFYAALAMLPDDSPSRLRLGYVSLNGEILATFSGAVTHNRMNVLLSSLADSPFQRQSPGAQLRVMKSRRPARKGLAITTWVSGRRGISWNGRTKFILCSTAISRSSRKGLP